MPSHKKIFFSKISIFFQTFFFSKIILISKKVLKFGVGTWPPFFMFGQLFTQEHKIFYDLFSYISNITKKNENRTNCLKRSLRRNQHCIPTPPKQYRIHIQAEITSTKVLKLNSKLRYIAKLRNQYFSKYRCYLYCSILSYISHTYLLY